MTAARHRWGIRIGVATHTAAWVLVWVLVLAGEVARRAMPPLHPYTGSRPPSGRAF